MINRQSSFGVNKKTDRFALPGLLEVLRIVIHAPDQLSAKNTPKNFVQKLENTFLLVENIKFLLKTFVLSLKQKNLRVRTQLMLNNPPQPIELLVLRCPPHQILIQVEMT